MADTKNFRVEHGINIGTTEVVNSSGKVQASAVSTLDTDDITEGTSNTYFTTTRVNNHLADASSAKTINNATIDGGTF
tara:strand:- start:11106 stop:11339 length:234 start_codon:yes stop_codon:yes gene_type:complete